jgi:hypothetical protein
MRRETARGTDMTNRIEPMENKQELGMNQETHEGIPGGGWR